MDILTFELDSRRYAFPAQDVVQVVQMVAISPLPGAPAVVEGVVNVRGSIVPVFDLRARFGLPPRPIDPGQHLVILGIGNRHAALRVDSADDFISIPDSEIAAPEQLNDSGVADIGSHHLAGVAATSDGTLVIHDLRAFLSSTESEALDRALVPTGG